MLVTLYLHKAVEKKNDDCKRAFFHSSKKWFPTLDMLIRQENLNDLKHCEREKRDFKYVTTNPLPALCNP